MTKPNMKYLNTLIILKHNAETYMSIIKSNNKKNTQISELKEKIQKYEENIENHQAFILAEILNPN